MSDKWLELLSLAAARAQVAVDRVIAEGLRAERVGVGASGDTTLRADKDAEAAILKTLGKVNGLNFVSEEAGEFGDADSKFTAIIDPLDGSSNFRRGIPFYGTSIAIIQGRSVKRAVAAVVRNLVSGDVYSAEAGKGAMKNGSKVKASTVGEVRSAVAGVDLSGTTTEVARRASGLITELGRQVHFGANALELCMVSDGSLDAFIDIRDKLRMVDFAAGYLICKEGGGVLTSQTGEEIEPPVRLDSRFSVIASANQVLHDKILRCLSHSP